MGCEKRVFHHNLGECGRRGKCPLCCAGRHSGKSAHVPGAGHQGMSAFTSMGRMCLIQHVDHEYTTQIIQTAIPLAFSKRRVSGRVREAPQIPLILRHFNTPALFARISSY